MAAQRSARAGGASTSGGSRTAAARAGGRRWLHNDAGAVAVPSAPRYLTPHLVAQELAIAHEASLNKVGQGAATPLGHRAGLSKR